MSKILSKKQIRVKRIAISITAAVALIAVILFYLIVTESGHWLVDNDEFDHVNWVVVLDGQTADMERTDFAAGLMLDGKADSILILGRRYLRNRSNAEFYADDFLQQGPFDSNAVFIVPHDDPSTIGEAFTIVPWLKKHHADTVLLITAAAATHRVKRIFTTLSGESPVYLTTDIHHPQYNADIWYTNRESCKQWLREWAALAVSYYDLWNADTLSIKDSVFYKSIVSAKDFEDQKNPVVDLQSLLPKVQKQLEESVPDSVTEQTKEPATDSTVTDSTQIKKD